MSKKLVWLVVLVLVSILISTELVSAVVEKMETTTLSGGSGGSSGYSNYNSVPTPAGAVKITCDGGASVSQYYSGVVSSDIDCTVSNTQYISTQSSPLTFVFKSLHIKEGAALIFISSSSNAKSGSGKAGTGESSILGGDGGSPLSKGFSGVAGVYQQGCTCNTYGPKAGAGGSAGGSVQLIVLNTFTNDGLVSVDGYSGGNGTSGGDACEHNGCQAFCWDEVGGDGSGGGGGGGAGQIWVRANSLNGMGIFSASGGNGGSGGDGGSENCGNGGGGNDRGANAGAGGGGDAGIIKVSASTLDDHFNFSKTPSSYNMTGGAVGGRYGYAPRHGLFDWSGKYVTAPASGKSQTSVSELPNLEYKDFISGADIPFACNNGIDDDINGLTDMQDPDCYNLATDSVYQGSCPSTNYGPNGVDSYGNPGSADYSNTKVSVTHQSSPNGYDGCCGDDMWLNGGFEFGDGTIPSGDYMSGVSITIPATSTSTGTGTTTSSTNSCTSSSNRRAC